MVKIGLIGAGHLGKIHLKLLKEIPEITVVGFYDTDPAVRAKVAADFEATAFDDLDALIAASDAVDIVTPTLSHFTCAMAAMEAGKHIFVEKPLAHTMEEAETLKAKAIASGLVSQVGHVERFNPAFLAVEDVEMKPMFIEGHRLAQYNPRGTDVSVILDLMIHDIDVVLSLVDAPVRNISASGVSVISETPDIANARLEFENGCVANLTASRISMKNMRKLRFFQKSAYLSVDFLDKKTEVIRLGGPEDQGMAPGKMTMPFNTGKETKYLVYETPEVREVNSIKMELEEFARSIAEGDPVRVSLADGYEALKVAHEIVGKIMEQGEVFGV